MPSSNIGLLAGWPPSPKRRVFLSYHHGGDQHFYDEFTRVFSSTLELFHDTSLDRAYDSDDVDYVKWAIRQNNISGSSCTVVLCGAQTHARKYVDWEIKATLDKQHGLIGVWLPTLPLVGSGTRKPDRLQDNLDSGYAKWVQWNGLTAAQLKETIEAAIASPSRFINNARPMRQRNG